MALWQRLLFVAAVALLTGRCLADVAEGETTPLANLVWHDGMLLFNGTLHKTIPPGAASASPDAAVPCGCSDAPPRATQAPPFLVTTDCFYQALYGNCNASFMASFLPELVFADGFCQMSCGRCPCCTDPAALLKKLGATRFLQALAVAQPSLLDLLSHPGYMGTILVPTDAAFDAALAKYSSALQDPGTLQQILKFHMLPPEPRTRGLWTTLFMSVGATLWTSYDGPASLKTSRAPLPSGATGYGGLTGIKLQGPVNSASVVGPSDLMSCKAYLTVIDAVLLPFDPTAVAASGSLGAALGSGQCTVQANAGLNATSLVDGASNRQHTVGDCCASCQKATGCNAFQYCALKGGCRLGDGTLHKFGFCQLMHDGAVAAGNPPAWADYSATTPLISGYTSAAGPAAAGRRLLQKA